MQEDVRKRLNAPQEELFDETEEEVLETLYAAWMASLGSDTVTYDKVSVVKSLNYFCAADTSKTHLLYYCLITNVNNLFRCSA